MMKTRLEKYTGNHGIEMYKVMLDYPGGSRILEDELSYNDAIAYSAEYEAQMMKAQPPSSMFGGPSTHFVIDSDGTAIESKPEASFHVGGSKPYQSTVDAVGLPWNSGSINVGKISPYFGDPNQKSNLDIEKLKMDMIKYSTKPMMSEVKLDDFLHTIPIRDMINAIFWQMAKKEGYPGVFPPDDQQYQDICNHIFSNYVEPQDASKHAPHNRPVATKGMNTALATLLRKLNQYRGIRQAKLIYEDLPNIATITIVIDPAFEFDDDDHVVSWESNLARLFKEHKPAKLNKLEVMFTRTEVF